MQEDDTLKDLALLEKAAKAAGDLAMQYFRGDVKSWHKSPGHPVTEADIAVNDLLYDMLMTARPDYGWLSEETHDDLRARAMQKVFVVDPIDGTRAFMQGREDFCIALAIVDAGQPSAGVVYNPVVGAIYAAATGHGATLNARPIHVSSCDTIEGCGMIAERIFFEHPDWPRPWPDMVFPERKPNATAYRLALVASGRWDAAIVLWRKGDWDLAAASLIVREAGGMATDHEGEPFIFNQPHAAQKSIIAANPKLHQLLIEKCHYVKLPDPARNFKINS